MGEAKKMGFQRAAALGVPSSGGELEEVTRKKAPRRIMHTRVIFHLQTRAKSGFREKCNVLRILQIEGESGSRLRWVYETDTR